MAVAVYLQFAEGKEEFASQEINDHLKHLGYPIPNITKVFTRAMETKPKLLHQTRKEGTSQQSRKKYKVTLAGREFIQAKASKLNEGYVPTSPEQSS